MELKRFKRQNFSLFLVKFKKLGFSAPLISIGYVYSKPIDINQCLFKLIFQKVYSNDKNQNSSQID